MFVSTRIKHTDTNVHTDTPQANTVSYKLPRPEARPHDTPGKGELAVTTEKVQISRVNINTQLGLCSPHFFYFFIFFIPLPMMAFSCSAASCQDSRGSDMTINKCGFMLLSLPVAGFYDAVGFFLICEDKQPWSWD